jgi:SAM-dependent methyltransferase
MQLPRLNYKNLSSMQTVEEIYKLMLNRTMDATGKETWSQAIKAGEYTRYKQIKLISRSDEFLVTFDNISRSDRLCRALSMLSLLKMERATPMQQSELVYNFILNRAIDDVGAKSCAKRINQFWFSPLVLIARLMRSAEFKQPYFKRTPLQQLHRARMLWVQQLPPANTILDIGGSSPNVPEGALIEMGYPHRPEKLIIFDKPPHEQYWGTPNYSQANTLVRPWGQVQYMHGYAEDILNNDELRYQKFDMIYMGQVVEHIFEDKLPTVLNWIKEHLAEGGKFIFDTPNRLITRFETGEDRYIDPDHKREYTPKEFAALLSATGFTVNQQWAILDMPNVVSSGTYGIKDFYSGEPLSTTSDNGYCFAMACEYDLASVFNNISSTISLFSSVL